MHYNNDIVVYNMTFCAKCEKDCVSGKERSPSLHFCPVHLIEAALSFRVDSYLDALLFINLNIGNYMNEYTNNKKQN